MSDSEDMDIPVDWKIGRLGDIAQRVTRKNTISNDNVLTISAKLGLVNQEEYFRRSIASSDRYSYWLLRRGDFAYNKSYSEGYPAGVVRRLENYDMGIVSPLYICFRPNEGTIDSRFLHYYFDSGLANNDILWIAKEGARNHGLLNVKVDDFFALDVPLPPMREQRRIADILDALGGQIRRQGKIISKLSFVRDGLVDSLLSGVTVRPEMLADFLECPPKNGYSPKEIDEWSGTVALGLGCLTSDGFRGRQLKNVPDDPRNRNAMLCDGDLLMSRANTRELVGLVGVYRDVGFSCIYPDLMMRLTPTSRCRSEYLELALRGPDVRRQIQAMAQGTSESMVKISSSIVCSLSIRIPEIDVQDSVVNIVNKWRGRVVAEESIRRRLIQVKEGLERDLLTGRVRIPEAEAKVEDLQGFVA